MSEKIRKNTCAAAFFALLPFIGLNPALAALNPASVYCDALGYEPLTVKTEGGENAMCRLPSGEIVDAWKFLLGDVGEDYSYCAKKGFPLKIVDDWRICLPFLTDKCAVCILPDGSEVEVTRLMNLHFRETSCGDGRCGLPENHGTCARDCPSGEWDGYCDAKRDGKCDPNCTRGEDPDCRGRTGTDRSAIPYRPVSGTIATASGSKTDGEGKGTIAGEVSEAASLRRWNEAFQEKREGHHRHRAHRHGQTGQLRLEGDPEEGVEEPGRHRDEGGVVSEGPE